MGAVAFPETGQTSAVEPEHAELFERRTGLVVGQQPFKNIIIAGKLREYLFPVLFPVMVSTVVVVVLAGQTAEFLVFPAAELGPAFQTPALSEFVIAVFHVFQFKRFCQK